MLSAIGLLWTLLSAIVCAVCSYSFTQPFWFVHKDTMTALGMYTICIRDLQVTERVHHHCGPYGGSGSAGTAAMTFSFSNLPSGSWQAAAGLYGGGCAALAACALLALLTQCLPGPGADKRLAVVTGCLQTLAVLLLIGGLTTFPLGLRAPLVRQHCGRTQLYDAGQCQVGWSFMLAIIGTALAMFSPFLAQYTDITLTERSLAAAGSPAVSDNNNVHKLTTGDYSEVKEVCGATPAYV